MSTRPNIFGRLPQEFGGAFSADSAIITLTGETNQNAIGLLAQGISINYTQNISPVYEIGSRAVYLVRGRGVGQGVIQQVVGPKPLVFAFHQRYGNVCNAGQNIITFRAVAGCSLPGDLRNDFGFALLGTVITSWQFSVQSPETMVMSEELRLQFIDCIPV